MSESAQRPLKCSSIIMDCSHYIIHVFTLSDQIANDNARIYAAAQCDNHDGCLPCMDCHALAL